MKRSNLSKNIAATLAAILTLLVVCSVSTAQPPTSAESSPISATRANDEKARVTDIVNACAAAANELEKARGLIAVLERENTALRGRIQTAANTEAVMAELNADRISEAEALRTALAAKNEALAAKDAVIAGQDKLVDELKRRKTSPWKRLGDVLIGVAAAAILK